MGERSDREAQLMDHVARADNVRVATAASEVPQGATLSYPTDPPRPLSPLSAIRSGATMRIEIGPRDRQQLVSYGLAAGFDSSGGVFRKTARIIAVQARGPFVVETDHGQMTGEAGDWIATNHPDDDPSSDVWPISADRMRASYLGATEQLAGEPSRDPVGDGIRAAIEAIRGDVVWGTHSAEDRNMHLAVTALEDALLRLSAPAIL